MKKLNVFAVALALLVVVSSIATINSSMELASATEALHAVRTPK